MGGEQAVVADVEDPAATRGSFGDKAQGDDRLTRTRASRNDRSGIRSQPLDHLVLLVGELSCRLGNLHNLEAESASETPLRLEQLADPLELGDRHRRPLVGAKQLTNLRTSFAERIAVNQHAGFEVKAELTRAIGAAVGKDDCVSHMMRIAGVTLDGPTQRVLGVARLINWVLDCMLLVPPVCAEEIL